MSMRPGQRIGLMRALGRLLALALIGLLGGAIVAAMAMPFVGWPGAAARDVLRGFEGLPDAIDTPPLPQRTLVLAADGSEIASLYYQNRQEVPILQVAPHMRQAIVAIEDSRFLDHRGFDLRGGVRALARNTSAGGVQEGASTLTMQYVKNVLVNAAGSAEELAAARGQSSVRKIREVRLALALERKYSKSEILQRYLNIVYFGAGAYGVEAAARRYFSKAAADLTLPEAATLAGIVQQPVAFDPTRNPDLSQKRRDVVLRRMAAQGFITPDQEAAAIATPIRSYLRPSVAANGCTTSYAPFFCDYVVQTIRTNPVFGSTPEIREAFLRRGGYTIRTTLDPTAQRGAFTAAVDHIPINDDSRRATAISMVEPGTGNIIAMTQNREWGTSGIGKTTYNYNVGRDMGGTIGMQAGSTFKVFTLAAALEQRISPFEEIKSPSPATFNSFVNCETGAPFGPVTVRNSTGQGTFTMPTGTAYSINTFFMALEERTGLCRPAEIAESMGVRLGSGDPLLRVPSFTLGTMEVTPLAMAGAYAAFANHGAYCEPRAILEITDRNGDAIPIPNVRCSQVLDPNVADSVAALLTYVIDGPIQGRTGGAMALDRSAAGKTGTTNESAAVWFCGFTPDLAAAVWVGDPRGGFRYPMKDITVNGTYYRQVFGGTLPGPIWKQAMTSALVGTPPRNFQLTSTWGLKPGRGLASIPGGTDPTKPDPNVFTFENGTASPAPSQSANADESPGDTAPAPTVEPAPAPSD